MFASERLWTGASEQRHSLRRVRPNKQRGQCVELTRTASRVTSTHKNPDHTLSRSFCRLWPGQLPKTNTFQGQLIVSVTLGRYPPRESRGGLFPLTTSMLRDVTLGLVGKHWHKY
ncbi:hypothetical protein BaRGS_00024177 [Batillaria attramentaria]|uniref:Uncharacterized protein n=1 Tax=Batillaria attramentaria TaxID=370345 RepID=A0ABD0KBR9_9CAEN